MNATRLIVLALIVLVTASLFVWVTHLLVLANSLDPVAIMLLLPLVGVGTISFRALCTSRRWNTDLGIDLSAVLTPAERASETGEIALN